MRFPSCARDLYYLLPILGYFPLDGTHIYTTLNRGERDKARDVMDYAVYTLSDPQEVVRYVGMSKDTEKRYKQHTSRRGSPWIKEILGQGLKPRLTILETVSDLTTAQEREKFWIHHYEGQGFVLENIVHNEWAIREREEDIQLYDRVYATLIGHNSPEDADTLTRMTIDGYKTIGYCAWGDRYDTVLATIQLLSRREGFGLHLTEFDAAELTFNLFNATWKDSNGVDDE
jgi:predicted GIY-YIG superfamily endonuclease